MDKTYGNFKTMTEFDRRAENSKIYAQTTEMKPEVISSTCWYGC